jgi:hypothetical protein
VGKNFGERNMVHAVLVRGKLNPVAGVSSGAKGVPFYRSSAVKGRGDGRPVR